jgi:3-methyladenine DNA glycosylase AlkD
MSLSASVGPMTGAAIHRELVAQGNPDRALASRRYFKTGPGEYAEDDRFIGISVPVLRAQARRYQHLPLGTVTTLLRSPWHEERQLALIILVKQYARADDAGRATIHALYLRHTKWINNWDLVDCSAEFIVGAHLPRGKRQRLFQLARSTSVWERRIAMLATFHYIKQGEHADTLRLARLLISDPHDLIHKATGWMLREVGARNRTTEERFLRRHATHMPRTMLRYAIERFPARLRRQYLSRPRRRATSGSRPSRNGPRSGRKSNLHFSP